jgi:SAM-dependent methyltransferase
MEQVNCDLCGSDAAEPVARQSDLLHLATEQIFTVVRCCKCGLHFTNPRPTEAEIGSFYSSDYSFHRGMPLWRRLMYRFVDQLANGRLSFLGALSNYVSRCLAVRVKPDILDPVIKFYKEGGEGTFLDIGCGSGFHAHFWGPSSAVQVCRHEFDVAGIEVSPLARLALDRAGIRSWPNLSSVPLRETFGMIRMNWSLEHVHSPSDYFRFIATHLSTDGQAVITVPNYDGLIYRLAPDCVELPIHLYHFRQQDILAYADRYGLTVTDVKTFSYPEMYSAAAKAGLLPSCFSTRWRVTEAKAISNFLKPIDDLGWGNDMLILLRKSAAE